MLTIRTEYITNASGKGQIRATGHNRQRTITYAQGQSVEVNHAKAMGTLLNLLTTPEQQAKVKHPSGGQRVRTSVALNCRNWYIDV